MDTQAAIDRIRKLIKHAQGEGATEAELESYMAKARAMMEQFNIDESEVYQSAEKRENAYDSIKTERGFSRSGKLWQGDRDLGHVVGTVCDTRVFTGVRWYHEDGTPFLSRKGEPQSREFVHFFGMPRDVAISKALYAELKTTVEVMAAFRGYGSSGMNQAFRSYFLGFVARLYQKALEQKRTASAEAGTTAIVLVKDQLVNRYAEEKLCLRRSKARGSKAGHGEAYAQGMSDGSDVSLGTNGIGGTSKPQARLG